MEVKIMKVQGSSKNIEKAYQMLEENKGKAGKICQCGNKFVAMPINIYLTDTKKTLIVDGIGCEKCGKYGKRES